MAPYRVTGAAFTLAEWCLVIGAITFLAKAFDNLVLAVVAGVLQLLVIVTLMTYFISRRQLRLFPIEEQRKHWWKFAITLIADLLVFVGLYYLLASLIGEVIRAASEKL